jgi:hypothetical protein
MIFPAKFNKPEELVEQKVLNTFSKLSDAHFTIYIGNKLTNNCFIKHQ